MVVNDNNYDGWVHSGWGLRVCIGYVLFNYEYRHYAISGECVVEDMEPELQYSTYRGDGSKQKFGE